jgi:hypothetical protein
MTDTSPVVYPGNIGRSAAKIEFFSAAVLEISRGRGFLLSEAELDDLDRAKAADRSPEDKWASS